MKILSATKELDNKQKEIRPLEEELKQEQKSEKLNSFGLSKKS